MHDMRVGTNIDDIAAVQSALGWWRDAGVDIIVGDEPYDWLGRARPVPAAVPIVQPTQPAKLPDTLDAFQSWLATSDDAPEARWGSRRIAPAGDPATGLMIVADLPDAEDAAEGRLFNGPVGTLFDHMLAAIGRTRETIYLTSLASIRPVGGRIDEQSLARLADLLRQHVMLARPKRLLLLGDAPNRALLGMGFVAARNDIRQVSHHGIKVDAVASFHPRQLYRQPALKAEAWRDLQSLMRGFGQ